jgi:hypothetical protein
MRFARIANIPRELYCFRSLFSTVWCASTACFCLYGEARIESGLLLCFIVRFPEVILCDRAVRLLQGLSAW